MEVKHGVRIRVFNLYNKELGNPELPEKLRLTKSGTDAEAARADEGFWVAVLPFKYSGQCNKITALAEGLSEAIVTGLSRFSYLRSSHAVRLRRYADDSVDVRSLGKSSAHAT